MKRLLLTILLLAQYSFASESDVLPSKFDLLDGNTAIQINFTDVIEDRYTVNATWFPDIDIAPILTGKAVINFSVDDGIEPFTKTTNLFHIPNFEFTEDKIVNKEVFELKYSDLSSQPFYFKDVNFDDTKELIIVEARGGQRGVDDYQIHLIQELRDIDFFNVLDLTKVKPYSLLDGLTEFNPEDKTVRIHYSGGSCSSSYETYQRVFNAYELANYKFKLIKRWDYDYLDEDGNNVGCHVKVYDVENGWKKLNLAESGVVN